MAIESETGTFTKDNSGTDGEADVISLGFTPKAIIIWGTHGVTSNAEVGTSIIFSQGFSDGSVDGCIFHADEDGQIRQDTRGGNRNDACVNFVDQADTLLARASSSFGVNEFTITWDTNDTEATLIHYIAYGGADITGVEVGTFDPITTDVNQSVTVTSADVKNITAGEGILFVLWDLAQANSTLLDNFFCYGAATSTSKEACYTSWHDDNDTLADIVSAIYDNRILVALLFDAVQDEAEFNGFDSDGFDINWINSPNTTTRPITYLIMKGGQWDVGNETANTSAATKATTTVFQPKGLIMQPTKHTSLNTPVTSIDISQVLGASDDTTETSGGWCTEADAGTTVVGGDSSITKSAKILDPTADPPTVESEADVDSFNATDFTLDWTTSDGTAYQFFWVVCGDDAAPAAIVGIPKKTNPSLMI